MDKWINESASITELRLLRGPRKCKHQVGGHWRALSLCVFVCCENNMWPQVSCLFWAHTHYANHSDDSTLPSHWNTFTCSMSPHHDSRQHQRLHLHANVHLIWTPDRWPRPTRGRAKGQMERVSERMESRHYRAATLEVVGPRVDSTLVSCQWSPVGRPMVTRSIH